jgi:ElaB/YqjD/DUF883 family membrane-anchored ribosome-binding protein
MSGEPIPNKLAEELNTLVADVEALLAATAGQAGEKAAAVRARMHESLAVAKAKLGEMEEIVIDQTKEAARAADQYVHEHPWRAVGAGALAGLVLGLLIGRR